MRRLRFIPALLVILSACSERIIEHEYPSASDEVGVLSIALTNDVQTENIRTKADADEPVLEDFRVALYKKENLMRLYNDSYANTVGKEIKLEEYLVQAITGGTDDVGKVHIQIEHEGDIYYGFSANTDIVTASVEAYVNAISKIL